MRNNRADRIKGITNNGYSNGIKYIDSRLKRCLNASYVTSHRQILSEDAFLKVRK